MSDDETVADVLAEMRGVGVCVAWTREELADVADRIEAARERELGDGDGACPDDGTEGGDGAGRDCVPGAHGAGGVEAVAGRPAQVTAELREWVEQAPRSYVDIRNPYDDEEYITGDPDTLLAIADRIDGAVSRMVPLPVRMRKQQDIERENSRLYGMLSDMHASRDAERLKRQRGMHERDLYLSMLRDARDEYVRLRDEYKQLSRDYRAACDESGGWVVELRDRLVGLRDACDAAARACGEAMGDE